MAKIPLMVYQYLENKKSVPLQLFDINPNTIPGISNEPILHYV